jgi:hypothetical protein
MTAVTSQLSQSDPSAPPTPPEPAPIPAKKKAGGIGALLVGGVVGGALGFLGVMAAGDRFVPLVDAVAGDDNVAGGLALIAGLIAFTTWAAILVHEAGHAAAGRAVGFRFYFLVAGFLRVDRDELTERLRVRVNRDGALFGGVAACLPTDTRDLTRRLGWMIAGGPLASLALALVAGAAASLPGLPPLARLVIGTTAVVSGLLTVVTLVPMRASGFVSDGGRLLRIFRGGPTAEREGATLPLLALSTAHVRPREWPAELIGAATRLRDGTADECYAAVFAYLHALDAGRTDEAGRWMDRIVELSRTYPPSFAPALFVEAAYFEAFHRGRLERARALMAEVPEKSPIVKAYARALAEAAIALRAGEPARARELAAAGLEKTPAKHGYDRERLEEVIRAAAEARASESASAERPDPVSAD